MTQVVVQAEDFDVNAELLALRNASRQVGAIASFVGLVRDINEGDQVATMELEHYPGMTEKSIEKIVDEAYQRWQVLGAKVIHRVGKLEPSDQIVFVAVSSMHRGDAFAACEFIMDYLKTQAPFWKREATPEGDRWVEQRDTDHQAAQRWHKS